MAGTHRSTNLANRHNDWQQQGFGASDATTLSRTGIGFMTRALFLAAAVAAAAISGAAPAGANPPACHATIPNCDIVPGMQDGVVGQSCPSWTQFTFGFDPSGNFIACVSFDGGTSRWSKSSVIAGVKQVGTPCCNENVSYCPTGFGTLAQAPDGRPLQCNTVGSATTGTWAALPQGNLG